VLFKKGVLGAAGSNKFLFDHVGIVEAHTADAAADLEAVAIEAGANDFSPLTHAQNDDIPEGATGAHFVTDRTAVHAVSVWLKQHGYMYGLGGYWSSHDITVESGDAIQVRPVDTGPKGIQQYGWESKSTWYDPSLHYANFLVVDVTNPIAVQYAGPKQAAKQFGPPVQTVLLAGQEILIWNKNLLADLSSAPWAGQIPPAAAATTNKGTKTYAFPAESSVLGGIYNPATFAKYGLAVPKTYSDVLSLCTAFRDKTGKAAVALGAASGGRPHHRIGEPRRLLRRHASQKNRHQERRYLVIGNRGRGHAAHKELDLGL